MQKTFLTFHRYIPIIIINDYPVFRTKKKKKKKKRSIGGDFVIRSFNLVFQKIPRGATARTSVKCNHAPKCAEHRDSQGERFQLFAHF